MHRNFQENENIVKKYDYLGIDSRTKLQITYLTNLSPLPQHASFYE